MPCNPRRVTSRKSLKMEEKQDFEDIKIAEKRLKSLKLENALTSEEMLKWIRSKRKTRRNHPG